jgi:hypothetical protein
MHGDGPPDYGPNGRVDLEYDQHSLVAEVITTPNSGDRNVYFPSGGDSDFVAGDPDYEGICEVCHTQANYYRNYAFGGDEHPLYSDGDPVDPDWDCTSCHSHSNELCRAANQIHATHFTPPASIDFSLDEDGCYNCHADGRLQCTDAVLFDYLDPKSLAETTICASALCHPNP